MHISCIINNKRHMQINLFDTFSFFIWCVLPFFPAFLLFIIFAYLCQVNIPVTFYHIFGIKSFQVAKIRIRSFHTCPISGGPQPRQAQLGASQRRPPRPDHGGGLGEQGQHEAPEGGGGGQEAPRRGGCF